MPNLDESIKSWMNSVPVYKEKTEDCKTCGKQTDPDVIAYLNTLYHNAVGA